MVAIYLRFEVTMCKRFRVHNLQSQKYLFNNISSLNFWYFPRMCRHIPFEISQWNIFHCQEDVRAILEPAKKFNKHGSFSVLSRISDIPKINSHPDLTYLALREFQQCL
jgi:hypothetical protein